MLRPCEKLPERVTLSRASVYEADVREFARKKMDVAIIEKEGKTAHQIAQSLRIFLKSNRDKYPGIQVAERRGVCYLYRDDRQ